MSKRRLTKRLAHRRPLGGSGSAKRQSGFQPFVAFCSTTFGAGVNAPHCPIPCPKRRQPETLSASFVIDKKNKNEEKALDNVT